MSIQYDNILSGMPAITLDQMDSVRLLSRIDTKYLTDERILYKILSSAASMGYLVFENSGCRTLEYRSLYYDTPFLQMYLDHHNRHLVRQKLRTRCYVSSGVTFFELKTKNNHGRTKKKRIEIPSDRYCQASLTDSDQIQWLTGKLAFPADTLTPSLETTFYRITLVNPEYTERTTIDLNLHFRNYRTLKQADMGPLVIIEVKQDGNLESRLRDVLLDLRVKPISISKYCIGTAITSPGLKSGRFKKKIMLINKMIEQYD